MPKHVAICFILFVGSVGFKVGTIYQHTESPKTNVAIEKPGTGAERHVRQMNVDSAFEKLKVGDECIVDVYDDHSGIYTMKVVSKVSPEKILVESHGKMQFIKFNQIVPKKN